MSGDFSIKEQATQFLGEFVIGSAKYAWKQINYITNSGANMESLKSKMVHLSGREYDIETELNRVLVLHGKKRKREVEIWLQKVKRMKNEVNELENKFEQGRWSFSHFWRLWSHLKLGKLVTEKIKEVEEFEEKSSLPDELTAEACLESGKILPKTTPLVGTIAESTRNQILVWLEDPNIRKIGVYGLGGTGKTAIMKYINNHLKENTDFNYIFWVTASKALDLLRIQSDIAQTIDLELPEDDYEEKRSEKLYNALMRRKKFLLILDGVSNAFPLEKIGIPEPDEENGCKIVVTTRTVNICGGMETQKEIEVGLLSEMEAWELFQTKVGTNVIQSVDIEAIAKEVVDQCHRLPLAIITVGRALSRVEDVRVWKNAINKLKCCSIDDLQEGICL